MQKGKQNVRNMLDKLNKNGLTDLKNLERNQQMGQCNASGLSEFLEQNAQEMTMEEMLTAWAEKSQKPGKGGIDRGRADAPLVLGDSASEDGLKFKEQALPPASLEALKESERIGISIGSPMPDKSGQPSQPGVLNNAAGEGGSAFTQTVLPRHRSTIQRYFERRKK
jgi:hypothetical protein